jgi:hypothetical protein
MRAFEIYLNGKKLCVAGVELGDLHFGMGCGENTHGRGEVGLSVTALLPTKSTIRWQQRPLRMNDQVRVKIVESETVDRFTVLQEPPRDARKYEKAYVRRMAKEFGWTIQAKSRKSRSSN